MRPIEFRAKRIDNGEWVEGYYAKWQGDDVLFPLDPMGKLRKVDPPTVGQFTGLHDKNGNKIWEGDIVMTSQGAKDVFYDNTIGGFCFSMKVQGRALGDRSTGTSGDPEMSFPIFNAGDKEIIGNIHENQQP